MMENEVKLKFLAEEAEEEKKGIPRIHAVSPSEFIALGLELEDEQYVHGSPRIDRH